MKKNSTNTKKFEDLDIPIGHKSRRIIRSMKAKADSKRTGSEKIADVVTYIFGGTPFLILNVLWFLIWILINVNLIPGVHAFDPYPFGLLTMIVSLEAILLSIFVLMSQNRAAKIGDLREETDLQLDMITEEELTKLMGMVATLMKKQGININNDKELLAMLKPTDLDKIEKALTKEI